MTIGALELGAFGGALAVGAVVGATYCIALRRAVRRLASTQHRAWSYLTGSLMRTVLAATALAAVGLGEPQRAAVAVLGFVIGRGVTIRALRDADDDRHA